MSTNPEPSSDAVARRRPILLDPYAARSCPVKTHNRYDQTLANNPAVSRTGGTGAGGADEALLELFAGGKAFEQEMLSRIAESEIDVVDLRTVKSVDDRSAVPLSRAERVALTEAAVASGASAIVAPTLPEDVAGHRRGHPDLLLRGPDTAHGGPGYFPVEVKRHRVAEQSNGEAAPGLFSTLDHPLLHQALELPEWTVRASREADFLQLAHYWRLLDAAHWASDGVPRAGLIGTDRLPDIGDYAISWVDLGRKFIRTFSRRAASGWTLRSPLERYDHEFGFRVKVAEVASRRVGGVDDPAPMVTPIVVRECDHCLWWASCAPQLDDDDLSLRIAKTPLDVREIGTLRGLGVETLTDLANADLAALLPAYLPEVAHRSGAEERLRLAARRASLLASGVELERVSEGRLELPECDIEVDLDIETTSDDRVYLWGFYVHDRRRHQAPYFVEFSLFDDLSLDAEVGLARQALTWLHELLAGAETGAVYHYSEFEPVHITRLARRSRDPHLRRVAEDINAQCVDLFTIIRTNFFGASGLGLKVVAHSGPGFNWRDDEPGGLNSQRWFKDAVSSPDPMARDAARRRVLDYNEDDVRATHALRAWLRESD